MFFFFLTPFFTSLQDQKQLDAEAKQQSDNKGIFIPLIDLSQTDANTVDQIQFNIGKNPSSNTLTSKTRLPVKAQSIFHSTNQSNNSIQNESDRKQHLLKLQLIARKKNLERKQSNAVSSQL